ncbi:MAG: (Fe-S)-binding protein [Dehalococcoidales bacterium]|nr:(Fe-S)-binding protein [Dehalococcoidales bacterium]
MDPVSGVLGFVLFWGLTALAAGIFFVKSYQLLKLVSLGRGGEKLTVTVKKAIGAVGHFVAQECQFKNIRKKDRAGIGHLFMMWGFLFFVTYYVLFIVVASGFGISDTMEHNAFYAVYCWIMDIVAPFVFIGALWGILRRFFVKTTRLEGQRTWEALFILITVLFHPITHVGKIATQIAAGSPPAGLGLATPPISTLLANLYANSTRIEAWHTFWFWAHWIFVIVVLAIIAYTRYLHVIAAAINDIMRPERKGTLAPIDLNDKRTFGVGRVDNFTRRQLMDTYACVVCGYCQDACPANFTQKPLNPRLIVRDVKSNLFTNGPLLLHKKEPSLALIGGGKEGSISEEALWACTTCYACMEVCPVYIEHVPKIIEMRRHLVQMQSKFPGELLNLFENMEQRSNPWGIVPSDRVKWATDIDVKYFEAGKTEYLFYVGCFGSFDSRSKQTTVAIAKILDAAGVSWGILGKDEKCCGDSLRRLGNEYVYDRMARENIKFYQEKGITKIITECPHCFTVLKNEYPQYGAKFEVMHHTEFINQLLKEGKLKLNGTIDVGKLVIHDSCYLGRHNNIYEAPRAVVAAATGKTPIEMDRNRKRGFCCGADGGRMWLEESVGKRIYVERTEEALKKDPQTICVACPYCMTMFADGLKDKGVESKVQVLDVAEIVAKALK